MLQSTKVYTVLYILEIPEHINNLFTRVCPIRSDRSDQPLAVRPLQDPLAPICPIRSDSPDSPDPIRSIRCVRSDPPDPMRNSMSDKASVPLLVERCRGKCAADPPGPAAVGRAVTALVLGQGQPRLTGMICKAAATASSRIHLQQRMPRAASSASNRAPTARARGEGRSCAPAARSSLAASTGIVVTSHCLATSTLLLSARSAPRWSPISATTTNQRPGGAAAVQARGPVSLPAHPARHGAAERANAHEAAPAKLQGDTYQIHASLRL